MAGPGIVDKLRSLLSSIDPRRRRLSLETDQLSTDFGQALSARLDAVRAAGPILRATSALAQPSSLGGVFDDLVSAPHKLIGFLSRIRTTRRSIKWCIALR